MGPMGNPFGEIGEIVLTMKLAPDGTLEDVNGMDEVVDKMAAAAKETMTAEMTKAMADLPPEAKAMMGKMGDMNGMIDGVIGAMKKMMGNEAMKSQLQPLTGFYPDQPVRRGSTWTKSIPVGGPVPMNMDATYTVAERGGGFMNVTIDGDIKSVPGSGVDMGFMKTEFDMSGTQSGTMQLDEATGWVTASTIEVSMEGSMKVAQMSTPMKVEGKVYTKSYTE
jgi:Family of unknown function (DUF6263)